MSEGLFDYPWMLSLLVVLPFLGWLMFGRRGQRQGPMLFSRASLFRRVPTGLKAWLVPVLDGLLLVVVALLVVASTRPSIKTVESAEVEGIDIYIVLDLSGSMQAVDVTDQELRELQARNQEPKNRFEIAREVLSGFVKSRHVDRIGMVVFARDAFLQFPLTLDYNTILTQLDSLTLGDIDGSGTAIGNALGRAVAGLQSSDARTRLVILITDGDRRGGNISPMQAAEFAEELGVKIFPILVGTEGRTRVPVGKNVFTGKLSYRNQEYPVNPALLQEIADKTGGRFYRATDKEALERNLHDILDGFERSRIEDASNVRRDELAGVFIGLAIALLVLVQVTRYAFVRPFP